jgi:hypothetical protein
MVLADLPNNPKGCNSEPLFAVENGGLELEVEGLVPVNRDSEGRTL